MTGEQTFLVTGFKKVPVKREGKRQDEKMNKILSVQFYVNIICREDLPNLKMGRKKSVVFTWNSIVVRAPGNVIRP